MRTPSRHVAVVVLAIAVAALAANGASAPPKGLHARDFLAAARRADTNALRGAHSTGAPSPAVTASLRVARTDLEAALDTLGAAELEPSTTSAIRSEIVAAVALHGRALSANASGGRLTADLKAAIRRETRAAGALGDAPRTPVISERPIGFSVFGAFDIAVAQDGHSVWVAGADGSRILLYPSLAPGLQPIVMKLPPGSFPHGIVVGPDDALYVAETGSNVGGNAIVRLTKNGERRQYPLPVGLAGAPWGIAVGPDRNIWFTEVSTGKIGRLDPASGKVVEYDLPTADSQPQGIVAGPAGALWGTEVNGNRVFRISLTGRAVEFPIPTPRSQPASIAPGRGGVLWVAEYEAGKLLRVSAAGRMREFPLPGRGRPYGLTSAPDGNVWFGDRGNNAIGVVTPGGRVVEYPLPTPNAQPTAIVPLALGDFAFTEFVAGKVGRIRFETR